MVSGPGRDMCESMTNTDQDDQPEPEATPWPKLERGQKKVEWPPELDESTWGEQSGGALGEE